MSKVLQGSGIGQPVSKAEGRARLDAVTIDDDSTDWAASEILDAEELMRRLRVTREEIDVWQDAGQLAEFRNEEGACMYPLRQFHEGRPAGGIDRILQLFPNAEDAWEWLVTPNRMTDGKEPVESLLQGQVDFVEQAAQGRLDFA